MIHSCFHRVNTDDNLSACAAINTPWPAIFSTGKCASTPTYVRTRKSQDTDLVVDIESNRIWHWHFTSSLRQ